MENQSEYIDMDVLDIENIIQRAVAEQCAADKQQVKDTLAEIIQVAATTQRMATERQVKDTFTATEKRLYAYPVLKLKIANDREKIHEIQQHGLPDKSKMVIGLLKSGTRLTPDEIKDALIHDIEAQIAESEAEIAEIDRALAVIAGDPYEDIVRLKYYEDKSTDDISVIFSCDPSTVKRNRNRLVGRMSVFLYGTGATAA